MQEIKFGPTSAGEYITPYQTTIIYDKLSYFETSVATLSKSAQLLEYTVLDDVSLINMINNCEHLSPEVLIFNDTISKNSIDEILNKGFQFVHIFSKDIETAKKKYYQDDSECNKRIVVFDIKNIYMHVKLMDGVLPVFLLEHIIHANFPQYHNILQNSLINQENGRRLLEDVDICDLPKFLWKIASSVKGFELIEQKINYTMVSNKTKKHAIDTVINNAPVYDAPVAGRVLKTLAIESSNYFEKYCKIIPTCDRVKSEQVDLAVLYKFVKNDYKWLVTLLLLRDDISLTQIKENFNTLQWLPDASDHKKISMSFDRGDNGLRSLINFI